MVEESGIERCGLLAIRARGGNGHSEGKAWFTRLHRRGWAILIIANSCRFVVMKRKIIRYMQYLVLDGYLEFFEILMPNELGAG